ncbi:FtsK/SpoIIIE family DNA translocase [Candidatus Odyssella thessalonicensis]|uniref:FtsK/SpoIIIE family DNA translocase n=1 Tax=Candidatus Odyssella thessalonicensis TaxID=84647 RepID=UPI000225AC08|nr:DNA translocase FtsK 4TM domain-containing protein [Candidatus Odyssella thessalonicensis]
MARNKLSSRSVQLLPPEVWNLIRRKIQQLIGVTIASAGTFALISILTYSAMDASLNTASAGPYVNWLKLPGAIVADLLLQFFGLASFMVAFAALIWGGTLVIEGRLNRPVAKMVLLLIALALASIALTAVPRAHWFFDLPQMGGIFGLLLLKLIAALVPLRFINSIQMVSAAGCGVLYVAALGLNVHQWGAILASFKASYNPVYKIYTALNYCLQGVFFRKSVAEEKLSPVPSVSDKPMLRAHLEDRVSLKREVAPETVANYVPIKSSIYEENNYSDAAIDAYEETYEGGMESRRKSLGDAATLSTSYTIDDYQLPSIELLDASLKKNAKIIPDEQLQDYAAQLEQVLAEFGVRGDIVGVCPGPVVTLYELKPAAGIKTSRVIGLADDIARSMSAHSARIAVIPGRNVIGIELPNPVRETVYLRELLLSEDYQKHSASLAMILGKDIGGNPIIADLARMPHLLVAGTTGSGKSVAVNTMILSLLYRMAPNECKFIMIDPKMLELSVYDGIPHLLTPVVTDSKKAVVALKWAVREMESRYRAMSKLGVRNIDGYNTRIQEARQSGEVLMRRVQTGFDPDTGKPIFENQSLDVDPLPYIVVVVDEMADLMLVAGKEIETAVQRLAQMARAAGIHLIMATQRPSVDVITGTIKANFPTRISFMVTSKIDSRTILGEQGAEQLLGQGDMLYMAGGGRLLRVHGPFVKDTEVERIVQFLKTQGEPTYIDSVTEDDGEALGAAGTETEGGDALYQQAVDLVRREGKASTSFVQRHLQIGYNRAARMIEQMEKEGLITPANHVGKREVIG